MLRLGIKQNIFQLGLLKMIFDAKDIYISDEHPFLRPYMCRGVFSDAKVILAGINPATPLFPSEISVEKYIDLIGNYEAFMAFYKRRRMAKGKSGISRTRTGIQSFIQWINDNLATTVIETNIITYPTANIKELFCVAPDIIKKSQNLFWNVLLNSNAEYLIMHGKKAFDDFKDVANREKVDITCVIDTTLEDAKTLEQLSPVAKVLLNGKTLNICVIRHLMYYGKSGASYNTFKTNFKEIYNAL